MDGKKNSYTVIISVIVAIFLIEISLRIIGFNKYQFKGYPPYYLTKVGKYDNFVTILNSKGQLFTIVHVHL